MKAVNYKPEGRRKGPLTTMIGNGFVTLHPGVNIVDDKILDKLHKSCKAEFKCGTLADEVIKHKKTSTAATKIAAKVGAKVAKKVGKKKKKKS